MSQGMCANCETTQGPFRKLVVLDRPFNIYFRFCKNDLEGCKKRRERLDRSRWEIKK
jgi:hypothetical protein